MSKQLITLAVVIGATSLLGGCASDSNTILHGSRTMLGVELSTLEGGEQTAKVGYSREEALIMPVRNKQKQLRDAYSTLSYSELDTGVLALTGLTSAKFTEFFASGLAADNLADAMDGSGGAAKVAGAAAATGSLETAMDAVSAD